MQVQYIMKRNFVKINETDYFMVSEPTETDKEMTDNGYEKVTDAQFDKAFNLYEKVQKKEIMYKDVLRELISMGKLQIANELLKNTTNIYLKNQIENYIANVNGYIHGHVSEGDFEILDDGIALDMCITYIEKDKFDIKDWQLFEIPIYYAHVFYNPKTEQMFDIAVFEDGKVIPRYIKNGNEKDATSIQEAIEKYTTDINSNSTNTENAELLQTFIKEMISFSGEKGDFSFELLRWSELQPYWCVFACKRDVGECLTGIKGVTDIGGHYCIGEEANLHTVLSDLADSGWPVKLHSYFFTK